MKKRIILVAAGLAAALAVTGMTATAFSAKQRKGNMSFGDKPGFTRNGAFEGRNRFGGEKVEDERPEFKIPELTEEQKAEMLEKSKATLDEMLADGKITQEQYDESLAKLENGEFAMPGFGFGFGGMKKFEGKKPEGEMPEFKMPEFKAPEMTEEQKAEMLEKAKAALDDMLEKGKITQEQYDESLAKLENGEFAMPGFGFGFGGMKKFEGKKPEGERPEFKAPEMTEEQKAEMLEKAKATLDEMLADGKITQEQYDESLAKLENGEFAMPGFGFGGGMNRFEGKKPEGERPDGERPEFKMPEFKAPEMTEEQKAEMLEKAKAALDDMLEKGKITQEQYDETLAKLESGECAMPGRGIGFGFGGLKKLEGEKADGEKVKGEKPAFERPERPENSKNPGNNGNAFGKMRGNKGGKI